MLRSAFTDSGTFAPLLVNRGVLLARRGNFKGAEAELNSAITRAGADQSELAPAHFAMGKMLADTGRFEEAADHFQAALNADQAEGFYGGMADDLQQLGDVYLKLGDAAAAAGYWKRAVRIYALTRQDKETDSVMNKLKAAASKSGTDLAVTELFVQHCRERKADNICE